MRLTPRALRGAVKTDRAASPTHKGMTCFISEEQPGAAEVQGLTVPPKIRKMGKASDRPSRSSTAAAALRR